jgi:hypothetical protein
MRIPRRPRERAFETESLAGAKGVDTQHRVRISPNVDETTVKEEVLSGFSRRLIRPFLNGGKRLDLRRSGKGCGQDFLVGQGLGSWQRREK